MVAASDAQRAALIALGVPEADLAAILAAGGQVWDTAQLQEDFVVEGFMAPFVVATRRADGVRGTLEFTHRPRFYFGWSPE